VLVRRPLDALILRVLSNAYDLSKGDTSYAKLYVSDFGLARLVSERA